MLGTTEIIIILIVVGLLFFGKGKIGEIAQTMGRLSAQFKKGKKEVEKEIEELKEEIKTK